MSVGADRTARCLRGRRGVASGREACTTHFRVPGGPWATVREAVDGAGAIIASGSARGLAFRGRSRPSRRHHCAHAPTARKSRKESNCRPSHGGPLVVLPGGRRTSPQDRQRPSRRYLHVNRSIRPEGMWSARSPVARSTMAFARWFRSVGILVRLATWLGYGRDPVARRDRVPRVRREGPDPAWTINHRRRTLGPLLDPLGRRGGASVCRRDLLAA